MIFSLELRSAEKKGFDFWRIRLYKTYFSSVGRGFLPTITSLKSLNLLACLYSFFPYFSTSFLKMWYLAMGNQGSWHLWHSSFGMFKWLYPDHLDNLYSCSPEKSVKSFSTWSTWSSVPSKIKDEDIYIYIGTEGQRGFPYLHPPVISKKSEAKPLTITVDFILWC